MKNHPDLNLTHTQTITFILKAVNQAMIIRDLFIA
jgi:hypothetical protein